MTSEYSQFIIRKSQLGGQHGFKPTFMPDRMKDFQKFLTEWSITKGRSAQLQDCGMGKTYQYLVWAQNVVEHTNKPVLIATPAIVSAQVVREGEKFGIECRQSRDGKLRGDITVTNYEQLHKFDSSEVIGFVGDESSILKNFKGKTKESVTTFIKKLPYRYLGTATAAPNDFTELGTHSEALGELGYMDMLKKFFKNENSTVDLKRNWRKQGGPPPKWRFLRHAEAPFWRWVSSWARSARRPSDLGFNDSGYDLPKLIESQFEVGDHLPGDGRLFPEDIIGMDEQRAELRRTIKERCEMAAERIILHKGPSIAWGHLNDECDMLEQMIPGARQLHGRQSDEEKEEIVLGFINGQFDKLVTKGKISGFGMNYQHCAHMTVFPWHSYEEYYQQVRRCLRFGQARDVEVDVITTPGLSYVLENLKRKARDAERMFVELVRYMNDAITIDRLSEFKEEGVLPPWMSYPN